MQLRRRAWFKGKLDLAVPLNAANGFIIDICMCLLSGPSSWLPTAAWVSLLAAVDVPDANARAALHRMTKAGFIERCARDARPGYTISQSFADYLAQPPGAAADPRQEADGLTLVTFNVPEGQRADRHVIRTLLRRMGFAPLGSGVWIAGIARFSVAYEALEASGLSAYVYIFSAEYKGFAQQLELARRSWGLDALETSYQEFIVDVRQRLKKKSSTGSSAFADVVLTNNRWRQIGATDPLLPRNALPAAWPRAEAEQVRDEMFRRSLQPAREYVDILRAE